MSICRFAFLQIINLYALISSTTSAYKTTPTYKTTPIYKTTATYKTTHTSLTSLLGIQDSVDSQLAYHLHHLPLTISETRSTIFARIRKDNHVYLTMLAGIGGGRVLNTFAAQSGASSYSFSDVLTVTGQSLGTGAFSSFRVAKLVNPRQVNCGVKEYNHAWSQFPQLANMEKTYKPLQSLGCNSPFAHQVLAPSLLPDVAKGRVIRLMAELRKSVACLLVEKEGKKLDRELNLLKNTMIRRLQVTERIMETSNEKNKYECKQSV